MEDTKKSPISDILHFILIHLAGTKTLCLFGKECGIPVLMCGQQRPPQELQFCCVFQVLVQLR